MSQYWIIRGRLNTCDCVSDKPIEMPNCETEVIHVVEYDMFDSLRNGYTKLRDKLSSKQGEVYALEQENAKLKFDLADRSEKYHLFVESGLDQKCHELNNLKDDTRKLVEALKLVQPDFFQYDEGSEHIGDLVENNLAEFFDKHPEMKAGE